jgi:Subtilase family.
MNEVINKYGVVWVSSAGNNGPALCSVTCPPNISTTSVIGTHFLVTLVSEYMRIYTWYIKSMIRKN